jgi:2-dehydropantoate 2-reductase
MISKVLFHLSSLKFAILFIPIAQKSTMNTIFIIGAGAIGKSLAVALKREGKNVVILRGSIDDGSRHTEEIELVKDDNVISETIEFNTLSNFRQLDGIIVLTNKSYGNEGLSNALKSKTKEAPVVILQNGLGVERVFIENDFPHIYRCVLFVTSQFTSAKQLRFKPVTTSPVGIIKGDADHLQAIVEKLNNTIFPFRAEIDIQPVIWKKAIINSVFNSVCPLLEIDNGIFHRDEEALTIAGRVIGECITIAKEKGVILKTDDVLETLLMISKSSDGQFISTLQDIRNKRKTEIDTLNFEIVRIARTLNKVNLVQETNLLGTLTLMKSNLNK